MTTITVYDPAMCCSTGICGTDIDQKLIDLAADLGWLKSKGVTVERLGLSREPSEFAANDTIREIMQTSEGDDLPVFLVDGALKAKARYPGRAELAGWAGVADIPAMQATKVSSCRGPAGQEPNKASGCCGGGANAAIEPEKAASC
jgi:hypothetical protein